MPQERHPITYVTGLTGAGKSTCLASLGHDGGAIDFSDLLKRRLGPKASQWDDWSDAEFGEGVDKAAHDLVRLKPEFAAGHVFAFRRGLRHIFTTAWDLLLPCRALVWLSVSPHILIERRPSMRDRPHSEIDEDEAIALGYLVERARTTSTPLLIIGNDTEAEGVAATRAVQSLAEALEERRDNSP